MSHTEKMNFIARLRQAIQSYQGFTSSEKRYGQTNLYQTIGNNGNLDLLIQRFAEISLDIRPFLKEKQFINA